MEYLKIFANDKKSLKNFCEVLTEDDLFLFNEVVNPKSLHLLNLLYIFTEDKREGEREREREGWIKVYK